MSKQEGSPRSSKDKTDVGKEGHFDFNAFMKEAIPQKSKGRGAKTAYKGKSYKGKKKLKGLHPEPTFFQRLKLRFKKWRKKRIQEKREKMLREVNQKIQDAQSGECSDKIIQHANMLARTCPLGDENKISTYISDGLFLCGISAICGDKELKAIEKLSKRPNFFQRLFGGLKTSLTRLNKDE